MAGRRPKRVRQISGLSIAGVDDPAAQRALEQIEAEVQRLAAARLRDVKVSNLVIGTNRIAHGLGRRVVGYTITPTFCTIAFAHAINLENPHPEREVWIDVVGSDQDNAIIEVF